MQTQLPQLVQRNRQHPKVERNADGCIGPADGVDVEAVARVLPVPVGPVVRDGTALEDANEDKCQAKDNDKADAAPDEAPHALRREDAQVEEENSELEQRHVCKVENFDNVEELDESVNLRRGQRPDVAAEAIGRQALDVHDAARYADDRRHQRHPVIPTNAARHKDAVRKTGHQKDARDDAERD